MYCAGIADCSVPPQLRRIQNLQTGCVLFNQQDVRLTAERENGQQNFLWTPDAREDAFSNPNRAAFTL